MSKKGSEMAGSEFDAYSKTYADTVNSAISFSGLDVDFFTRAKAVRLIDVLTREVGAPSGLSVLDVGCGIGNYHGLLHGKVGHLTGVDPSSECIAEAEIRNPDVAYAVSDGNVLPFPDNKFDAAYAICVMHHVPPAKWKLFAEELARVTRPGGMVLIFEHNPYNPVTRRIVSNCAFDADAVLLSKRQVMRHLEDAGLRDVGGQYILNVPSIDGALRWIDDAMGFVPLGAQYYASGRR